MHDPSVLIFDIRPLRLDVWHDEPDGRDAFEVCGHAPHGVGRIAWTLRHRRHLHYRWWPYLRIQRWITHRCADCGQRFRWKEGRFSYQGTDEVWHDVCMTLRGVRSQLDDITAYVRAEADSNARWRVEHRLKNLDQAATGDPTP